MKLYLIYHHRHINPDPKGTIFADDPQEAIEKWLQDGESDDGYEAELDPGIMNQLRVLGGG